MTRDEARERLWELVFGDPSPEDARALEQAAQEDPDLAREVEALREMARAGRELPAPPLPREVRRRILREARRKVRGADASPFWQRWVGWSPVAMAAAATVAVAVVGAHLWQRQQEDLSIRGPEGLPGIAVRPAETAPSPAKPASEDEFAQGAEGTRALSSGAPLPETAGAKTQAPGIPGTPGDATERSPAGGRSGIPDRAVATRDRKARQADHPAAAAVPAAAGRLEDADRFVTSDRLSGGGGALLGASPEGPGERVGGSGGLGRGFAARKASQAPESAAQAAPAAAASREEEASAGIDASRCPARVRELRQQGRPREALAEARTCLQAGLAGEDLLETLDLAARIALDLGRKDEAEEYLRRLRALPGGEDRANRVPSP